MAEKGGYQRPSNPSSVSGIGKNSKRTDGRQAIKSPNVQDSTDLQQGDRERIRQGQRVAPLSQAPSPSVQASAQSPLGAGGGSAQLPPHLFGGESTRPDEPITEGMPFGPGAGPEALSAPVEPDDDKEFVLHMLSGPPFNNQAAANMLREIQGSRQAPPPMMAPPVEEMIEEAPELTETDLTSDEDLATEDEVAVEGDEDELSVETPEAAASTEEGGDPSLSTTSSPV